MTSRPAAQPRVEIKPLSSAAPDPANANLHTKRGRRLLESSLTRNGFFRPIAAAGKGGKVVTKAGNLTSESAQAVGMKEAIFIYTDGKRPIVHVRTDLDPDSPQAVELALSDNRIAELSLTWAGEALAQLRQELPQLVNDLWTPAEFLELLEQAGAGEEPNYGDLPPIDPTQVGKQRQWQLKIKVNNPAQLETIFASVVALIQDRGWGANATR